MLEDFIEANNLKARILPIAKNNNRVKCRLFLANNQPILVVSFSERQLDKEKIARELDCKELEPVSEKQAFEITGYKKQFLPPISIYGVKLLIDKKLFNNQKLYCSISETHFLVITAEEIQEQNEEVIVGDFSR